MRRVTLVLVIASAALFGLSAPAVAAPLKLGAPTFTLSGRGWGHGVGMPQYGAYGYSKHGWGYKKILAHFYPHTSLKKVSVDQVRVLLADGESHLTVSSGAAFRVKDANGKSYKLAKGAYTFGPKLKIKVDPGSSAKPLPGPVLFTPGRSPLTLSRPYRGSLLVSSSAGRLRAINVIGLEDYVRGVVPYEVPDEWPAEALKAQAVASRSYAVATRKSGGAFDLYADTRSQAYGGIDAESFSTSAAVDATAGRIVRYHGKPAVTYFYSSSGGRTAAIQDAWPGSSPIAYLVSVSDPWDTLSPYHRWGPYSYTASEIASKFGLSGPLVSARITRNHSMRVTKLKLSTESGSRSLTGEDVRDLLGLRSSWFSVGELALAKPSKPLAYDVESKLKGVAKEIKGVWLEGRSNGEWKRIAQVEKQSDGEFTVPVRATVTRKYRLSGNGGVTTAAMRIQVAPALRLDPATTLTELTGTIKPTLSGKRITIQRQSEGVWLNVGHGTVTGSGTFRAKLTLKPGIYRARIPAAGTWAAGTSPPLKVVDAGGKRVAVGVVQGASVDRVAAAIEAKTGAPVSRDTHLRAVFVRTRSAADLRSIPGAAYVDPLNARRLAFDIDDELSPRQWYLDAIHAFDYWPDEPVLDGPKIAVVDSGIDGGHPEFAGRIARAKSFVSGSALHDHLGHGTFVAGEIAAEVNNEIGIAGIAFPSRLLVAKVVRNDGSIPIAAEARAIHWAVRNGARVINLSLAGVRDPLNPSRDTYSPIEAAAVRYAVRHGVLVVAAVGNSDQAPNSPWNYAGYPAALPHVLGVSAINASGDIPGFSNRDVLFNDIAAPGDEVYSTLPRPLTSPNEHCEDQGYSDCGPPDFRHAEGTSFSAPMISAAAGLLFAEHPLLRPDQAGWLLTRAAADVNRDTGCPDCATGRDRLSGWGVLDVNEALIRADEVVLRGDTREPNDDGGLRASHIGARAGRIRATIDAWNDPVDVYAIRLHRNRRLYLSLRGARKVSARLSIWRPGTRHVSDPSRRELRMRIVQAARSGTAQDIRGFHAGRTGWFYVVVSAQPKSSGAYSLRFRKSG